MGTLGRQFQDYLYCLGDSKVSKEATCWLDKSWSDDLLASWPSDADLSQYAT